MARARFGRGIREAGISVSEPSGVFRSAFLVFSVVSAVDLHLTDEEMAYLEEPYVPHAIVGVMAQNKPADSAKEHVWLANAKYLKEEVDK